MPAREHESCARKFAELTERIESLELATVERHLQVMELAEKVAERLQERVRKRNGKAAPEGDEIDRRLALLRGPRALHEG